MTKVFVANTFNPDSTDDSNVLIAVMTPITEKTPMLIPSSVNEDLSLFFRMESIAIQKLSFNILLILLDCIFYSYLRESMGSSFAARYDGISPETTPTIILINMTAIDNPKGKVDGKNILMKKLIT